LLIAASLALGCPSAYDRSYDAEIGRLQRERDANRERAQQYVAVVLFALGSSEIDKTGAREIEWFVQKTAAYGNLDIDVKGYADSTGSEANNLPLSGERAFAVQEFLISRGVAGDRIYASGFGSSDPTRENTSAGGRRQNRRAELRIR
jgi:outer membrane protein OmpA-like peptidoglycan-associated protein